MRLMLSKCRHLESENRGTVGTAAPGCPVERSSTAFAGPMVRTFMVRIVRSVS
jgi:hypothetical protein